MDLRKYNIQRFLSILGYLHKQTGNRKRSGTAVSWGCSIWSIGQKCEQLRYDLAEKLLIRWSGSVKTIASPILPETEPMEGQLAWLLRNAQACREKYRSAAFQSLRQIARRIVHGPRLVGGVADPEGKSKSCERRRAMGAWLRLWSRGRE